MVEVSLRALRERHPQHQWTKHVGSFGGSYAYRGVCGDFAVTLIPYELDCREAAQFSEPASKVLRNAPRYLYLQQSNTGDPQSLYTGVLHGEGAQHVAA